MFDAFRRKLRACGSVSALRVFAGDARGVIAIAFGVAALPMLVLSGGAYDYTRAQTLHAKMQGVSDAAALAAGAQIHAGRGEAAARAAAARVVDSMCRTSEDCGEDAAHSVDFSSGVGVDLTGVSPTAFLGLIRIPALDVSVRSVVRSARTDVDLFLVLDLSGSMDLPHGRSEIRRFMTSFRPYGQDCAFACHTPADGTPMTRTGAEIAADMGIVLRESAARAAARDLIETVERSGGRNRVGLASFGAAPGSRLSIEHAPTENLSEVSATLDALVSRGGFSQFDVVTEDLAAWIEREETERVGSETLVKAVLVTDGVHTPHADHAQPMDPAWCDAVKARAELFIVHIEYPDPDPVGSDHTDWQEVDAERSRINAAVRDCATSPAHVATTDSARDFDAAFSATAARVAGESTLFLSE